LFVVFAIEADADAHTGVVFNRFSSLLIFGIFIALGCGTVGLPLDDKSSATCGNQ
jgi:hypothetical protein